ncbi:MAG: hypothetical protein Q8R44_19765 [Novosphingobium sp.]|nr:hypothetical protein [Novosphingobium sp.]
MLEPDPLCSSVEERRFGAAPLPVSLAGRRGLRLVAFARSSSRAGDKAIIKRLNHEQLAQVRQRDAR